MKKKVLHVSAGGLGHGGVSTVIFGIVEELYNDFDFSCVVFGRVRERDAYFEKFGKTYRLNCYPKQGKRDYLELLTRPFRLYFGIRRICKENKPDVIHCHNHRDEWICLLAAKHAGVQTRIAHSHNTNSPKKKTRLEKIYKSLSPSMMKKTATVNIGCSKAACKDFFCHDNFSVVPNAVDLEKYSGEKCYAHDRMQFIHVGRYTYQKNQEFVLETFAEVCKVFPEAHLFLVGFGEPAEIERLTTLIKKLNIEQNVEMVPGDKVSVPDYYAKSDYMIFPSRFEGFGIVLIEAQAMGIHCYVSENIQEEADVGLLTFLQLKDGPRKWAECIVSDIQNGSNKSLDSEKLSQYSNAAICRRYADIYNGKI